MPRSCQNIISVCKSNAYFCCVRKYHVSIVVICSVQLTAPARTQPEFSASRVQSGDETTGPRILLNVPRLDCSQPRAYSLGTRLRLHVVSFRPSDGEMGKTKAKPSSDKTKLPTKQGPGSRVTKRCVKSSKANCQVCTYIDSLVSTAYMCQYINLSSFRTTPSKAKKKLPGLAVLSKKQRRDVRRKQKDGYDLAMEAKLLWEKLRRYSTVFLLKIRHLLLFSTPLPNWGERPLYSARGFPIISKFSLYFCVFSAPTCTILRTR